jgi:enamine deaminase RidA (YjgF/YER057c/UK114 family)
MTIERHDINPDSLAAPKGYQNGVLLHGGRLLCIAGQIGWDRDATLVSEDFAAQFRQALQNVADVLVAAGGKPDHLGQMTVYVTDKQEYLAAIKEVGRAWRDILGRSYPAMALVEVADLLEEGAKVEIQALAMVP